MNESLYSKIMVPVDLAHIEKIDKSLRVAAGIARQYDAGICFVAISGMAPNPVAPSPEKFEAELNMFAREQADRFDIRATGRMFPSVDVAAELDDRLLEAITEVGADLVVMASHIPDVPDRLHLMSSNAAYIVRHAEVSVFVVR